MVRGFAAKFSIPDRSPERMNRARNFVSGLHNIGYFVALGTWLVAGGMLIGQLFFQGQFIVLKKELKCEQPLNNRCSYWYTVQDEGGSRSESELVAFRANPEDLSEGNRIRKIGLSFNYEVNGRTVMWDEWPALLLLMLIATVPAWISWRLTPRR